MLRNHQKVSRGSGLISVILSENMKTAPRQIDGAKFVAFEILDPEIHKNSGSPQLYADGALQISWLSS